MGRYFDDYQLLHYGVKGMKWGVRRYQNPDGTLTIAGRLRYGRNVKLKSGSIMYRSGTKNSKFMGRSYTYVSATDDFRRHSINTSEGFDGRFDTVYELELNRDIKCASFNDFVDEVERQYKKELKGLKLDKSDPEYGIKALSNSIPRKFREGEGGQNYIFNSIIDGLKEKGFDAVVDPVDAKTQYYNLDEREAVMAMVIFDPDTNLKVRKKFDI